MAVIHHQNCMLMSLGIIAIHMVDITVIYTFDRRHFLHLNRSSFNLDFQIFQYSIED